MITESIHDILSHALSDNAQAFQSALDTALKEKINMALEVKKHEISKNLVGLGEGDLTEMDRKIKRELNQQMSKDTKFIKNNQDKPSWVEKRSANRKGAVAYVKNNGKNKGVTTEEITDPIATTEYGLIDEKESNSTIAKKAHAGKDVGHGGFGKVAASAAKEYGSKEAGEKVAAAVMYKLYGHKK